MGAAFSAAAPLPSGFALRASVSALRTTYPRPITPAGRDHFAWVPGLGFAGGGGCQLAWSSEGHPISDASAAPPAIGGDP